MRRIQGWGRYDARIVLIGEAPGENEERLGEPFVGASGFRLKQWWEKVGLRREDLRIENLVEYRPPHNNIEAFDRAYLEQWMSYLHDRITSLPDPYVLVPTGNYALYALTRKGKVKWHNREGHETRPGITNWRGSILSYTDLKGREIKVIPTIHPAATFRSPSDEVVCIHDWKRIVEESQYKDLRLPKRTHETRPTLNYVEDYLAGLPKDSVVAVDIENPRRKVTKEVINDATGRKVKKTEYLPAEIVCMAFSHTPEYSLTVPLIKSYWGDHSKLESVWGWITRFLTSDTSSKVFHNGLYDTFHLSWERNISVQNYRFDTLYMHHCLDPADAHSLDYCASRDTREPYWKCLSPGTRILTTELIWKKIEELKVGDELIGFDVQPVNRKRRFRRTTVKSCGKLRKPCYRIEFVDGTQVTASKEHPWLAQKYRLCHSLFWVETQHLSAGMKVGRLCSPWETDNTYEGGWLAGLYDGEGSYGPSTMSFCQNPGDVLERGKAWLTMKGFRWKTYNKSEVGRIHRVTFTSTPDVLRFLGSIRPTRLLKNSHRAWEGKRTDSFIYKKLEIASVTYVGEQEVVGLETTTKTFIAEGLYTHNSEAKDSDEAAKYVSNWEAFLVYNGKDAAVTRELYDVYHHRLVERGQLEFYQKHYTELLQPLQALQLHGIRVDDEKRRYRLAHLLADCIGIQDQLEQLTGIRLYADKTLSPVKLKHYLYTVLGLPEQLRARKSRGEKTASADELAVRKLMLKYPTVLNTTGELILQHKRKAKLTEFYHENRVDADGRFRSSYSPNTEAGRLSSSSNPNQTGGNAQNVDRETRDAFIPDPGKILVEVDLSQAEARIDYALIYRLTGSKDMYERARLRPDEYDQHTENASFIFNKPTNQVMKRERYLGKKAVHGAFRDMQGKKLSDELLKEGFVVDEREADRMLVEFKKRVPGIEELFRWVRRRILEERMLVNSWGRRWYCTYDRMGDELFRRGYSFDPQSEMADWMNQLGFKPFFWYIHDLCQREGRDVGAINVHGHDSLVYSILPQYAYETTKFLVESLEQERVMRDVPLSIPCEVKCGRTWKGEHEWKRLPSRAEFDAVIDSLT